MGRVRRPRADDTLALGWREAAELTGISPWAMYKLFTTKEIPSFMVNGKLYCLRSSLVRWMESLPGKQVSA